MTDRVIDMAEARARKKAQQAHDKAEEKAEQIKAEMDEYRVAVGEWLDAHPLRYAQVQHCYIVRHGKRWTLVKPCSMADRFAVWRDGKFANMASLLMEERGWKYTDVTYSLKKEVDPGTFNLMDKSDWVLPQDGPHHWLFDCLMRSVGGGKAENSHHLEEVLCYKYLYPESYLVPAILVHGEGSVGKTLLIDNVLHVMYGGATISDTAKRFLGDFNELLKAKMVVALNEANADRIGAKKEELKSNLHKARISINEKGIRAYEQDNFALTFIFSNDDEGGIFLDRSEADRRYSVFHVDKKQTLIWWIAQHTGWTMDAARRWMLSEGDRISRDPVEIGRWLTHLIETHCPGERDLPAALHGQDYARLLGIQETHDDRLFQAIFLDEDFTHIRRDVIEKAYTLHGGRLAYPKLRARLTAWLESNAPHIEVAEPQIVVPASAGVGMRKRRKATIYLDSRRRDDVFVPMPRGGKPPYRHNDEEYIAYENYRPVWIGPEM